MKEILEKKIAWYKKEIKTFDDKKQFMASFVRVSELKEKIMLVECDLKIAKKGKP